MNMLAESGRKACTKCGEDKALSAYPIDNSKRGGRHTICKSCRSARNVEYYAERREYHAEYHAAHSARISERKAQYRVAKPHVTWEAAYRRRALAKDVEPKVESFTKDQLIARWGDACAHCGGGWTEVDHYPIPIAQGGAHSLDNCRPSCSPCNRKSWKVAGDAQQAV